MNKFELIDISTWNRKEHFEFFSSFDEPFFGVVSEVSCTEALRITGELGCSLFGWYLHKSLVALNEIREFRTRIQDDQVLVFNEVHASATIGREDGTFGFSFIPYDPIFEKFEASLKQEIAAVQASSGLRLNDETKRTNVIHYSSLPWSKFSGLTHARNFKIADSAPKITFGKIYDHQGEKMMAVSINAHHGLVDGLHVSEFLKSFQELMNTK